MGYDLISLFLFSRMQACACVRLVCVCVFFFFLLLQIRVRACAAVALCFSVPRCRQLIGSLGGHAGAQHTASNHRSSASDGLQGLDGGLGFDFFHLAIAVLGDIAGGSQLALEDEETNDHTADHQHPKDEARPAPARGAIPITLAASHVIVCVHTPIYDRRLVQGEVKDSS